MNDIQLGKKISDKHKDKILGRLAPDLGTGEEMLLMVKGYGRGPSRDTVVVTNERLLGISSYGSGEVEFAIGVQDIARVAFEGSDLLVKTQEGEILKVARLNHFREDEPLVRRTLESLTASSDTHDSAALMDPSANLVTGPRTKDKQVRDAVSKVDSFLNDGEQLLFMEVDVNDIYCLTSDRFLVLTGTFRSKAQEQDVSKLVRTEVFKDGIKWVIAGADAQHQLFKLAALTHENSARWLAAKFEEAYAHFRDPWRDEVRRFLTSVGLDYAFEPILPLLWPRYGDEELLSAFGGGEDLLIFTSARVVVLPDLMFIPREDWKELSFAVGRHEHYAFNGRVLETQIGMSLDAKVSDGRRFSKLQYIGDSEQSFNAAIPTITKALAQLSSAGYPVVEGADWVEQTQNPPPPPSQGPTSFIGYSMEF